MLISALLILAEAFVPVVVTAISPSHEWSVVLTGTPAFAWVAAAMLVTVCYFVGFLRYCASKGYSMWLAVLLFVSNVPGFIILLLLPDRTAEAALTMEHPFTASERSHAQAEKR